MLLTLETRYNSFQYNTNSVITRLQCWLPFRWELHPATVSTAGCDAWSKICRPPTLCNTRWNESAAVRSTLYMYVQRSSLQEGEGGVSNEYCGPCSGYWLWCKLICCVRRLARHMLNALICIHIQMRAPMHLQLIWSKPYSPTRTGAPSLTKLWLPASFQYNADLTITRTGHWTPKTAL